MKDPEVVSTHQPLASQGGEVYAAMQDIFLAWDNTSARPGWSGPSDAQFPGFRTGRLRNDEYPGAGVLMPVVRADMLLGEDGVSWRYHRSDEISHDGAGGRHGESMQFDGVTLKASDYSDERYSRGPEKHQLTSENPDQVEPLVIVTKRLVGALALYAEKVQAYDNITPEGCDYNYVAYDKQIRSSYPPKVFRFNVLNLRQAIGASK